MSEISTGGVGAINPQSLIQTDQTQGPAKTGAGAISQTGPTPDAQVSQSTGASSPLYSVVMQSMAKIMPEISGDKLDILLADATMKMKETVGESETQSLRGNEERKRSSLEEKQGKLDEAVKKQEEADEINKGGDIGAKIKLAFEMLAAVISIVIGAIMIATGVGAVAGALMIAAGVVGILGGIDSAMKLGNEHGLGIAGQASLSLGNSLENAQEADAVFGFVMVGVQVALAVGSIATSASSFALASTKGIDAAMKGQSAGASVGQKVAASLDKVLKATNDIGGNAASTSFKVGQSVTDAGMSVANATADIATASIGLKAAERSAEATDLQAEGKEMAAAMAVLDDFIDMAMEQLNNSSSRFNDMLDDIVGALNDRGDTFARARFQG